MRGAQLLRYVALVCGGMYSGLLALLHTGLPDELQHVVVGHSVWASECEPLRRA